MKRSAGILLPVTALPSRYGIGCFDTAAYAFVDFLKAAGQTYWQILPLGQTGYGDSPYQSVSAFAGNPYLIDLNALVREGLLTEAECIAASGADTEEVAYSALYANRITLLKTAFLRSNMTENPEFTEFCQSQDWLEDYALFMALKAEAGGSSWEHWAQEVRMREKAALSECRRRLTQEITFYKYLQFLFYRQWHSLKAYANANGIRIIGDIPIYAAYDSADVWAHPELFQLDDSGLPKAVAGCPPDGFAADGQLWGNPLYDWAYHRKTGYAWWIARLSASCALCDVVRIDHFRGFDAYYSIPYGEKTAKNGHWEDGPGLELFEAARQAIGDYAVIAEDLGFMTTRVEQLVRDCGFPNMKVLEFAFDSRDTGNRDAYLPHNYGENCVAYTGTHDNQPIVPWFCSLDRGVQQQVRAYLCDRFTPDECIHKPLIALLMRSPARLCIIPMQDWLGMDDTSRINTPATMGGNWKWRLHEAMLSPSLQQEIRSMTERYGRTGEKEEQHENISIHD